MLRQWLLSTGGNLGCDTAQIWRESAALSMQKKSVDKYSVRPTSQVWHNYDLKLKKKKMNRKRTRVDSPKYDYVLLCPVWLEPFRPYPACIVKQGLLKE